MSFYWHTTLDDILIQKIADDSGVSFTQLMKCPDFYEVYKEIMLSDEETLENAVYWVEERAYEGKYKFDFEETEVNN